MRVSNLPILALAAATILSACGADDAMLIAEILRGQQNPPRGDTPAPSGENPPPQPADDPPSELPPPDEISDEQRAVQAILDVNCLACHGEAGLGGFNSMDIDYLVDQGLIEPGDSVASQIVIRMQQQSMPPPAVLDQRPTASEIRRVARFIDESL
ncbi:MAG: cytochrome c [Polyangiaceae bacterium]